MIVAFYSEQSFAGKDSCADFAAEWLREKGVRVERDAFAWDGKCVLADALGLPWGWSREQKVRWIDGLKAYGRVVSHITTPEHGNTARVCVGGRDFIIGALGSPGKGNGIRGLDEGFWTRQVVERDLNGVGEDGFTVVSDLRFVEEAEAVCPIGYVIEVRRPGSPTFNEQRLPPELVDHLIVNDGTLEELRAQVETVMGRVVTDAEGPLC